MHFADAITCAACCLIEPWSLARNHADPLLLETLKADFGTWARVLPSISSSMEGYLEMAGCNYWKVDVVEPGS